MLRIIHTADWHLGQTLHNFSRDHEHARFLEWLSQTLAEREADALIIAGDVFDSANPSTSSLGLFYDFLARTRIALPNLDIVIIGGNHDSASRLNAPRPLLNAFKMDVFGGLSRNADGTIDAGRYLVPLRDKTGNVAAFCLAIPFLRACDLDGAEGAEDPLVEGTRKTVDRLYQGVTGLLEENQAFIITSHCYMTGTSLSELSERKILGGNQHALPAQIFPPAASYIALGHLHLAQTVGGKNHIRYSGSPIPLALSENTYKHQIVQVDFTGNAVAAIESIPVPRTVPILKVPETGPMPLSDVLSRLKSLSLPQGKENNEWPLLEIQVFLDQPEPNLRHQLEQALKGQPVRLAKISLTYKTGPNIDQSNVPEAQLKEINPEYVFRRRYQGQYLQEPPEELMKAFHELLDQTRQEEVL